MSSEYVVNTSSNTVTGGPSCLTGQRVAQKDCLAFAKFALGGNADKMGPANEPGKLVTGSFEYIVTVVTGCSELHRPLPYRP